jgi:hypothetical protein
MERPTYVRNKQDRLILPVSPPAKGNPISDARCSWVYMVVPGRRSQ